MPAAKGKTVTDPKTGVSLTLIDASSPAAIIHARAQEKADNSYSLAGAQKTKPFVKGKSGNPGGALHLGKFYFVCRRIFQDNSPALAQAAVEMALNPNTDERVRSVLLVASLDRAGVRPMDYDPSQDQTQPTWDPGVLTAEERADLKALLSKMVKK